MGREYSSKRSRRGSSMPQQLLMLVVTFVLGYFTASIFDINALSHWLSSQVLENHQPKQIATKEQPVEQKASKPKFEFYTLLANEKGVGAQTATSHGAPLNQQSVATNASANTATASLRAVNSSATVTAATNTSHAVVNKQLAALARAQPENKINKITATKVASTPSLRKEGNFVVQVASFKARSDAEHMKGLLILKGFEVTVVPVVTPNQGNWFRVVIGPYPNRILALKAQNILARTQRLKGMVRSA